MQRDIARHNARLHDGYGSSVGHKPGFIIGDSDAGDARTQSYAAYERDLVTAYRDATGEVIGQREGDICTVREGGRDEGAPGHLSMRDGKLVCVPDQPSKDTMPTTDERDATYARYDREIAEQ